MPFIPRPASLLHVGAREIGNTASDKPIVDEQLHLNAVPGRAIVYCPARNRVGRGFTEAMEVRRKGCEEETYGEQTNEDSFGN